MLAWAARRVIASVPEIDSEHWRNHVPGVGILLDRVVEEDVPERVGVDTSAPATVVASTRSVRVSVSRSVAVPGSRWQPVVASS
jgi:hypothetical protein